MFENWTEVIKQGLLRKQRKEGRNRAEGFLRM